MFVRGTPCLSTPYFSNKHGTHLALVVEAIIFSSGLYMRKEFVNQLEYLKCWVHLARSVVAYSFVISPAFCDLPFAKAHTMLGPLPGTIFLMHNLTGHMMPRHACHLGGLRSFCHCQLLLFRQRQTNLHVSAVAGHVHNGFKDVLCLLTVLCKQGPTAC
jgi:hypothetical protein